MVSRGRADAAAERISQSALADDLARHDVAHDFVRAAVDAVDAGVEGPRHHVVVRDTVLVAGQLSHEVVALALDERTGVPGRARRRVDAPSPTCVLPAS